jgi:hypothetical protein
VDARNTRQAEAALASIAAARRPWLERLELRVEDEGGTVRPQLIRALIAATPRLRTLALHGERVLDAFPHPAVRRLEIDDALLPIVGPGMPGITEITLELVLDDEAGFREHTLRPYLTAELLPALRRIDLSRNEPCYPPHDPPNVDVLPLARALPLDRLAELRLPSLRTAPQVQAVHELLAGAPALEIEIAHAYAPFAHLTISHPRLRLPAPHPWPPRDHLSSREALTITLPGAPYGEDVSLTSCIDRMEDQLHALAPAPRAAWLELWSFIAELGWYDTQGDPIERPFPAATLQLAVDAIDDVDPRTGTPGHWARLAELLRMHALAPGDVVQIRRYWGW